MSLNNKLTIEFIKSLGKERSTANFDALLSLYYEDHPVDIKREIISSIGRQYDIDRIYSFIKDNVYTSRTMEEVYQMFRTVLYKGFEDLRLEILQYYNNEVLNKMDQFRNYKDSKKKHTLPNRLQEPLVLEGNNLETLKQIQDGSIQLVFTSPPYYNAKDYSDYHSYQDYLDDMYETIKECYRVIEDGRFIIINVSPVISKRPGREFESIRYPIHYDFHQLLTKAGFSFTDEIIWAKPEASVPNRIGGFIQTKMPLQYKPNNITESIMVYRKNGSFLLDKNIALYTKEDVFPIVSDKDLDYSNIWYIGPRSSKLHPAIFPEELCEKVLKYYSFKNDVVLDPFAGIGTFGKVALELNRVPVLCEMNTDYIAVIKDMIKKNQNTN